MAGVYRPRHPERTVLFRVLFHYFDQFLQEYESRFEKEYGFFRPIIKEVVERYLDCGNPRCGFARIRCPSCGEEKFVMFSCRTRGFCPSCHSKRREEWGDWMRKILLLDVPHRQVVFGYYGLYGNAHRGKVRKAQPDKHPFIIEEESPRVPRRGWAEMIRKVFEVDPLVCPQCQAEMRIIAFLTDYAVVDRIINHLKLTFVAERPPPPHMVSQEFFMESEASADYFS